MCSTALIAKMTVVVLVELLPWTTPMSPASTSRHLVATGSAALARTGAECGYKNANGEGCQQRGPPLVWKSPRVQFTWTSWMLLI